jgi:hypothetical protein
MADDRSLKDIIRFLDPSGEISDSEIASIANDLKFSEVLDLISAVSDDKVDAGRNILSKHDPRFGVAKEYAGAPAPQQSGFKPIKPQGTVGALPSTANKQTNPNGPQDNDQGDLEAMVSDPMNKNKPEVKQIQSLLQRLQNR